MNRQFDHEKLKISMFVALIKANSDFRLHDDSPE
jgi:hypothetical protein